MIKRAPIEGTQLLEPGRIAFYRRVQAALAPGSYRLTAKQDLDLRDCPEKADSYEHTQDLVIHGPRFVLPENELYSVYPPANGAGLFHDTLPHAVFTSRLLPWMRALNPAKPENWQTPWCAMLLLTDQEMQKAAPKGFQEMAVGALLQDTPGLAVPKGLPLDPGEDEERCRVLELRMDVFQALCPTQEELPYLAHAREVDTGGKEIIGLDNGFYALLNGNRLCQDGNTYHALIVSLEGHHDHLPGNTAPPAETAIRLAVLANWTFRSQENQRGNFAQLMADLDAGLLRYPLSREQASAPKAGSAAEALAMGFMPLSTDFRSGETATSWYRGPLSPVPVKPILDKSILGFSDHLKRYDPDNGMFDLSYAAAWQAGRMLALMDKSFARAMAVLRRYLSLQVKRVQQKMQMAGSLELAAENAESLSQATALGLARQMKDLQIKDPAAIPEDQGPQPQREGSAHGKQ